MSTSSFLYGISAVFAAVSIVGRAQGVPTNAQDWIANGATACEKYLTPEFQSTVLQSPAGPAQRTNAYSCQNGSLYITLKVKDVNDFRRELPMIAGVHQMSGVGDAAYWNEAGTVSAVKGHDRGCAVGVFLQQDAKIHNAELAEKLGEICNKLFALP